ncbi:MAG: GGDEF domain-containing protein [Lachnospiraceae bacterium]|nr:GGDEF domain-containing protein [Lachnospiraceae bacterium]
MALLKNTKSNKTLNEKQWEEWNRTIFSLFWKIWLLTLLVELLLFLFYSPTPECSKSYYFYLFIVRPSGLELLVLVGFELAFTRLFQSHSRRVVSIYTILLISLFAGITVCVHTSVGMLPAMLLLPMMLTPLYRDHLMTLLQAVLVILLYIADQFYFVPNTPYMLPQTSLSPFIEICIFIGGTIVTYVILEKVNQDVVINEERSRRDSLTHLYNHEAFYEELEYYQKEFEKEQHPFSVIIADIDNFKKVNDTYGHAFGDEVIQKVGQLFVENSKKEGFSARYGGEEFSMLLPHDKPEVIAEKIRADFAAFTFRTSLGDAHFTLSLGAAVYDRPRASASAFFEEADSALYQAKRNGKNCVMVHNNKTAE